MKETFERVSRHLYKRRYHVFVGQWRTSFYEIFTDWQKIRRKFSVGENLDDARDELGRLRTLNKGRYDWDAEKRKAEDQRRRAVTFSQWGNSFLTTL